MANGVYKITEDFEKALSDYTGAPYVVTVDNQSNALFLALMYEKVSGIEITIPSRTYPSVPCEIIHAGGRVKFREVEGRTIKGAYQLEPTKVWDSALRFTGDMYIPGTHMCLSFTGPYKHLKLSKGGAILTDDKDAYEWFKRARYSGRRECSYHDDNFDMIGWNFYMIPELATRGLLMMNQFYELDGRKKTNDDVELPYPDLSKFPVYTSTPGLKATIIIPCYNFQDYISRAIDTALEQTADFEIEIIVGDDCSTDNSYEIIKSYGNRIRHYRNQTNLGALENIKKLHSLATGHYISYMDGDDFLLDPEKTKKQVDFLESNPEYSMHATGCFLSNKEGEVSQTHIIPLYPELTFERLSHQNNVGFGRTYRNLSTLSVDWIEGLKFVDWCLNFEISLNGKVKCEEWPSGSYRLTNEGMITRESEDSVTAHNDLCRKAIQHRLETLRKEQNQQL